MDSAKNSSAIDEYSSSGFFVLRTPLLPVEDLLKITGAGGDRAATRAQLRRWVERPEVREALWIASPEFVQSLTTWCDDPESAKGQKLEQALYRYLARMTARATPFGAFAGCSVGRIAKHTNLELGARAQYRRRTRLDMEYLASLAETVGGNAEWREGLDLRPNTSLHLAAGKYHHLQGYADQGARLYRLVATDPTPALAAALRRAEAGATAQSLAAALVAEDSDITREDAEAFVGRLIDSQILVAQLTPPVTGRDPVDHMIGQLDQPATEDIAEGLRAVARELRALDRKDQGALGVDLQSYEKIMSGVSRLGGAFKPGRLIQLDFIKPAPAACVGQRLVDDILRATVALNSIQGQLSQPTLEQFKDDFQERYQDRETPLLEALDDEAGVGFENEDNPMAEPLIEGIDFRRAEETPQGKDEPAAAVLRARLEELQAGNNMTLELDAELLERLRADAPLPLPDAFAAIGVCFHGPKGEPGFYLQSVSGPSGANLLARFCYADPHLAQCVQEHLRAEEALRTDGAVFAEIAHLPEGRVGNVVCRPVLRGYEIPFLATPGAPRERQIVLSDLAVSVRGGRIVLRSQRLDREVLPRLSSAHNFASPRSLKLYKFLCLLQQQGRTADLSWNWGALHQAAFLPRVTMGNVVFSPAQWKIGGETALELGQGAERLRRVEQWRVAHRVPRFAGIAEFDNQLLIDFESALAVETFLEHIRKRPETILMEMFPAPDALPVRGPEGSFVHEVVVPFVRTRPAAAASAAEAGTDSAHRPASGPAISFTPGSEWLFAKLYCSPSHADRLLLELVEPLVKEAVVAGQADGWFFARYGDPRWHLRLRFHGDPAALSAHVLPALLRRAEEQKRAGILWRLEFDAYEREVERYGGPQGLEIAERLFHVDSELCLELLRLISGDSGAQLRWQLALCVVDRLLSGLGLSVAEKKTLMENMRQVREQDWIVDETYRRQMAGKFRGAETRQTLLAILTPGDAGAASSLPAEAVAALGRFSASLPPIRKQLEDLRQAGHLSATITELAVSYVHMHLNRMLRSSHHEQETAIFDLLARGYASQLAREKPLTT